MSRQILTALLTAAACTLSAVAARAQVFDWRHYQGHTVNFLTENHPWANQVVAALPEFEKLTGITVHVDTFQEQQMRQRLVTMLQSKSSGVDVFMSLKSLEGRLYARAGWYADLKPLMAAAGDTSPDYDFDDLSPSLVAGETFDGNLDGIPLNIEGPIVYYRRDILAKCGIAEPKSLDELSEAAAKIKTCEPAMLPWVTRGLKPAVAYTFSNVLHNYGTDYFSAPDKPDLCAPLGQKAVGWYGDMMSRYGGPGAINDSFLQLRELYGQGRAAIVFESSNEFGEMMKFPGRADDTTVALLPPGPGGSKPTVIGWGLSISAFSKEQGPSWYLLQWATSKAMEAKLALNGIAPPRASVAGSPEYQAWLNAVPVRKQWAATLAAMGATGTSEVGPPLVRQPEARAIIGGAVGQVILGQATAKDAACGADKSIADMIAAQ